jgi:hypothetical protein
VLSCDPTATYTDDTNKGFNARWNRIKQSKEVALYGRLYSNINNVPTHKLPGLLMQIKLKKAEQNFFLINKDEDSTVTFMFRDSQLLSELFIPIRKTTLIYRQAE